MRKKPSQTNKCFDFNVIFYFLLICIKSIFTQDLSKDRDINSDAHMSRLELLEKYLPVTVEYQVIIPPNMVIAMCLKESSLGGRLDAYKKRCVREQDGLDYECIIGNLVMCQGIDLVEELADDLPDPKLARGACMGIRDCRKWWGLEQQFYPELKDNEAMEWGRCLSQVISVACHSRVTALIRDALV